MDDFRIGFLRGLGYIFAILLVSLILGTIIYICIVIRNNIQNENFLNYNIEFLEKQ